MRSVPFLCLLCTVASLSAQQVAEKLETTLSKRIQMDYLVSVPKGYAEDPAKNWPLLLFLHGVGECGVDIEKVKAHGPPKLIAQGRDLPFIVVSPQSASARDWWSVDALTALLDRVEGKYRVDRDREYVTGLSMGGYGTWALACQYPERFAAIAPVCGGGLPRFAPRLKGTGVWVFHGAKDPTVKLSESQEMVDALTVAGIDVKFTVYPEAGHDSWTETYDNPELYEWLLRHTRAR